ncbi:gp53-like domain-containing protein [Pseudomonas huaxiensis]|uniref:gp53-like domain-containing protein n=1 Tax=Pseudomonas huaxiensis TaxID=2213017 RepID=UPI0015AC1301|nr:hypothetical protein [Pseudomonas huaxiensis]
MADLPEQDEWAPGVYQLETSDPVLGGPDGIDNLQAKQLASRTRWLRNLIQRVVDGVASVEKAKRLETARTLRFKGAATGSGVYDGSADTEINLTLTDSAAGAGTYTKVSINAKGVVVGGSNPTTLGGHGITDGLIVGSPSKQRPQLYTDTTGGESGSGTGGSLMIREVQLAGSAVTDYSYAPRILFHWGGVAEASLGMNSSGKPFWNGIAMLLAGGAEINAKADKATTLAGYGIADAYTKAQADNLVANKADKATTLAGYGIADAYTKAQADNLVANKADKATTLAGYGIADAYTKAQADNLVVNKADKATTLAGYGITDAYTKAQADNLVANKADKATTLTGYGITDALKVGPPSSQRPTLYTDTLGGEAGAGTGGALMIREVQLVGGTKTDYAYAPRILFHWGGVAEASLGMNSSGKPFWNGIAVLLAGGPEISAKADKLAATTSVAGLARVATQVAVDAAVETDTFVTPVTLGTRLRAGFIWSNSYVVFPSWLGGLIFQWGTVATPVADIAHDVTFPIAFPNAVRTLQVSWGYVGTRTDNSIVPQIGDQTLVGFKANRQDAYTAMSVPNSYINYFAIGY